MNANLHPPGAVDKHERLIHYYWIGRDRPKERTLEEFYAYFFWQLDLLLRTEPLKYIRNGFLFVIDMNGFGYAFSRSYDCYYSLKHPLFHISWKNLDVSSKGKEIGFNLTGVFPLRTREFCVVNGGMLVRAAMQVRNSFLIFCYVIF